MSLCKRAGLAWALSAAGLLAPAGCSSERKPAETIEGKTPADYREQMEETIAQPPSGAPEAS